MPASNTLEHPGMHRRTAGEQTRMLHLAWLAREIRHHATGLTHEQQAGRDIPRRESQLPERFEATARHVGEIERRGAGAANASRFAHYAFQHLQILIDAF